MDNRVNYTAVGTFVVVLVVALVAIFVWLGARSGDENYTQYIVYLREEVSGLSVQSPVRYNGVPVGVVSSIALVPSNPRLVRVMLNIKAGTPINTSTVATLMSQGITGVDYIGLQSQQVDAPLLTVNPGEQYPVIPSRPSLLMQLSEVLPEITRKVSQLSDSVSQLFDAENQLNVKGTLANLNDFTATLKKNSNNLDTIMQNLKLLSQNSAKATQDLPDIMKELHQSLGQIDVAANAFTSASNTADKTLRTTAVAVNGLSRQVMPTAQQLLMHLNDVTTNLQSITDQVQRNPAMFIRGRKATAPGPGER